MQWDITDIVISIHALLAESDAYGRINDISRLIFLSTLSLRRATKHQNPPRRNTPYFYPRSPCGERQRAENHANSQQEFLSTLSLRRATVAEQQYVQITEISIHALLAESDARKQERGDYHGISIHALLAESD